MGSNSLEAVNKANEALLNSDPNGALRMLKPWIAATDVELADEEWADVYEVLSRVGRMKFGDDLGDAAYALSKKLTDPDKAYELGYTLIEHSLADLAIGVLRRAHKMSTGNPKIVAELVSALEIKGRHEDVSRVLASESGLVNSSTHFAYLKAFNSIMTGDIDAARKTLPRLQQATDEKQAYMARRVEMMLTRADALATQGVEQNSLRARHFIITGGILLHTAPDEMSGNLKGGYGRTWDTNERVLLGLRSLAAVIEILTIKFASILVPPHRDSQILGYALGALLQLPVTEWYGGAEAGLITVYDPESLLPELRQALKEHRAGQSLFTHVCCSLREQSTAPDVFTYFYEFNTSPWRSGISPDNKYIEEVSGTPEEIASRVLETPLPSDWIAEIEVVRNFVSRLAASPVEPGLAILQESGPRERIWTYSPVP